MAASKTCSKVNHWNLNNCFVTTFVINYILKTKHSFSHVFQMKRPDWANSSNFVTTMLCQHIIVNRHGGASTITCYTKYIPPANHAGLKHSSSGATKQANCSNTYTILSLVAPHASSVIPSLNNNVWVQRLRSHPVESVKTVPQFSLFPAIIWHALSWNTRESYHFSRFSCIVVKCCIRMNS